MNKKYILSFLTGILIIISINIINDSTIKEIPKTQEIPNIVIEINSDNNNFRYYHLRHKKMNDEVIKEICNIPGIIEKDKLICNISWTNYNNSIYRISVRKGTAFLWSEIEPKILEILNNLEEEIKNVE